MGKIKKKKPRHAAEDPADSEQPGLGITSSDPLKAIDGYNIRGWSDAEVKAYNELIIERQKLESQRLALEQMCSFSQTQRALLHECIADIDNMFQQQEDSVATFKYTGPKKCCVEHNDNDTDTECTHEICKRASTEGMSGAEFDVIKYYATRLCIEKSDRIRNALRKQRDLELIRVKKVDGGGQALNTRKATKKVGDAPKSIARGGGLRREMNKAAKETEKIVNKIINQLDDLRADLHTGRISAEEAQGKLNMLDSKLPVMQDKSQKGPPLRASIATMSQQEIKANTESFQDKLRERLLNAKGDTFTQAFSIMDHFLSATKPDDLQHAISELQDVLQLTGPMCDELQKSLGALEGIFDNPDKLAFTGPDGKQECTSIIDLMDKLKDTLKRTGQLPDGANANLTKVFQDCIDLETGANGQMARLADNSALSTKELHSALRRIKDECVAKSPIPPLTSSNLESIISPLLDTHGAKQLLEKATAGAEGSIVEASITSSIIARTQRKPELYLETLERLESTCQQVDEHTYLTTTRNAFANVAEKIKKWIPQLDNRRAQASATVADHTQHISATTSRNQMDQTQPSPSGIAAPARVPRVEIREDVVESRGHNLWNTFDKYCDQTDCEVDLQMLMKVRAYEERTRMMIQSSDTGVVAAVTWLCRLKLCPGISATIIAKTLLEIAETSENNLKTYICQLSHFIRGKSDRLSAEWASIFQHLVLAMIQLFITVYVETMAALPHVSAIYLAVSTVALTTTFVHLTSEPERSHGNLEQLSRFFHECLSKDVTEKIPSLEDAMQSYRYFCDHEHFRCTTSSSCSDHMIFLGELPFPSEVSSLYRPSGHSQHPISRTEGQNDPQKFDTRKFIPKLETTIHYRSRALPKIRPNAQSKDVMRKTDIKFAELMGQAAALHESTAKKALALLRLRADDYVAQKLLPPAELLSAMNKCLDGTEADYYHKLEPEEPRSETSSHFGKSFTSNQSVRSALELQNAFKHMRNHAFDAEYLGVFIECVKKAALSGHHASPLDVIEQYRESLGKFGSAVPEAIPSALTVAQAEVEIDMVDDAAWFDFESRRLKFLLGKAGGREPNADTLLKLAVDEHLSFDEYHEIVCDQFDETDQMVMRMLQRLWADITEQVRGRRLTVNSSSLTAFAKLCIEDWKHRPQSITQYAETQEDAQRNREESKGAELVHQQLETTEEAPLTLTGGLAKRPKVESAPDSASVIANEPPILSAKEIVEERKPSMTNFSKTERPVQTDTPKKEQPRAEENTKVVKNSSSRQSILRRRQDAKSLTTETPPCTPKNKSDSGLLLDLPKRERPDDDPMEPPSPGLSMDEINKRLAAMEKDTQSMLEGAQEMMKYDVEQGRMLQRIADAFVVRTSECTKMAQIVAEAREIKYPVPTSPFGNELDSSSEDEGEGEGEGEGQS